MPFPFMFNIFRVYLTVKPTLFYRSQSEILRNVFMAALNGELLHVSYLVSYMYHR